MQHTAKATIAASAIQTRSQHDLLDCIRNLPIQGLPIASVIDSQQADLCRPPILAGRRDVPNEPQEPPSESLKAQCHAEPTGSMLKELVATLHAGFKKVEL